MKKCFIPLMTAVSSMYAAILTGQDCCYPSSCSIDYGFYAEAVYLQPSGNDIYYGVESKFPDTNTRALYSAPNWKAHDIHPEYHLGFEIGAEVLFTDCEASLVLSWEQLYSKDSSSFSAPDETGFIVGPFFDSGILSTPYTVARGKSKFRFDEVNFNLGKGVCFTECFSANFYGGISYARIEQSLHSKYSSADDSISRSIKSPSQFNGIGPQLGGDYIYQICDQFSFIGNTTLSCFCGKMKTHTTYKSFSPVNAELGYPDPNIQKTDVKSRTQVVPSFEQKLGVLYLLSCGDYSVDFELGYRCQVYFNAVRKVVVGTTSSQTLATSVFYDSEAAVFGTSLQNSLSNFILSGPYATLTVQF